MTYQEAARSAIDCQNAANLSGVVHSFDRAISAIFMEAHQQRRGTDWINTHPIVTLYLSKLCSLNGGLWPSNDGDPDYGMAYTAAVKIAGGES
jgi:hypothetical protein